jgi:hypothetical protein
MNTTIHPAVGKTALPSIQRIGCAIGIMLLRCLALLAPIVAALLVALLPIGTSVPTPVWILLAVADVALIIALFWFKWTARAIGATIAGSLLLMLLAIATSQAFASTPPITDAQGKPIPGSIATLEKVNLNGSEQWITIRGKNINNPVLLYLGMGGLGGGGFATRGLFEPLEDHALSQTRCTDADAASGAFFFALRGWAVLGAVGGIHYAAIMAAMVGFVGWLSYWNLLGWKF